MGRVNPKLRGDPPGAPRFRVPRSAFRVAFTLVELLVVVTLIAVLLAILMPSVVAARAAAQSAACMSNLHQMGIADLAYGGDNHREALASWATLGGYATGHGQNWIVTIRPWLGNKAALVCPSTTRPPYSGGTIVGTATTATLLYDAGNIYLNDSKDDYCSYGYNNWLEIGSGHGTRPEAYFIKRTTADVSMANVPVFGDAMWPDTGWTTQADADPAPPYDGVNALAWAGGTMKRHAVDRHRMAVNFVFRDGGAHRVKIFDGLRNLTWSREWVLTR